jgi:hypothetical protein
MLALRDEGGDKREDGSFQDQCEDHRGRDRRYIV